MVRSTLVAFVALTAVSALPGCRYDSPDPTEQNKLVVRRFMEEVVNTGHVDRLADFISPDYVEVFLHWATR